MRRYREIYEDFLEFTYKTSKDSYYKDYFENVLEEHKLEKEAGLLKAIIDLCYDKNYGMFYFCKFVLGDLKYAGYEKPVYFNKLWSEWEQLIKTHRHLAILASRQIAGKTTFFSIILPIYIKTLWKNQVVTEVSATARQAEKNNSRIQSIIKNNEFLVSKADTNRFSASRTPYNGKYIECVGVGTEIRGESPHWILCDDILRGDNKLSDKEVIDYVDEVLEPMTIVNNAPLIIVGTPKNAKDIFAEVLKRMRTMKDSEWRLFKYPAILDREKKIVLTPDRFTYEQIISKERLMGRLKFSKEFLCECFAEGASLFPPSLTEKAKDYNLSYLQTTPKAANDNYAYFTGVDVARSGESSADYTAIVTIRHDYRDNTKTLVGLERFKGVHINEQIDIIGKTAKRFNSIVMVERNSFGEDFINMLIDNFNITVESFLTTHASKENIIRLLISNFENNKIKIPYKEEEDQILSDQLVEELNNFSVMYTKNGTEVLRAGSGHDDLVLSLSFSVNASKSLGSAPFAVMDFPDEHSSGKSKMEVLMEGNILEAYYSMNIK